MRRLRSATAAIRSPPGLAAIVSLGVAWGLLMHSMGWAQLAHFAQVRAFAEGQAEIDPWHWETKDKGWVNGHFYSVKAPGVAGLSLPFYAAIDAAGGRELAERAAENARRADQPRWSPPDYPLENYGYDPRRAERVEADVERGAPVIWALTLIVAVIPALLLLLGVRSLADRLEPGYGTAAAVTLGLGTVLMTFASEYFSHVLSAGLGFAAFALLIRERQGPPRPRMVAAAGLAAGLAVTFEFQVGLVGVILFLYALARSRDRIRRALAYGAGALAGAAPALLFNQWALGSPFEFAYGHAVAELGFSGHDRLGLNSDGFFGIGLPTLDGAVELLLANRGLLTLTPIVALAGTGVVLMRRRGHRAEANVIAAVSIVLFLYNAGYWLPMGGGTPGPRFLIPALPFLALGLAFAYRRMPAITLALAIPSALFMVAGAITYPLIGEQGTGRWWSDMQDGVLEHTVLTVLGVGEPWLAIAPVLAALAASAVLAVRATPRSPVRDLRPAVAAVLAWAAISAAGPTVAANDAQPLSSDRDALWLIAAGAGLALCALAAIRLRKAPQPAAAPRAAEPVGGAAAAGGSEPAMDESTS